MAGDAEKLVFDPEYHAYWWDRSVYVPSVTQIIDSNGHTSEFCKSKSHADRGTEIHDMIEIDVKRRMDGRTLGSQSKVRLEQLINRHPVEWDQFQSFCADFNLKFMGSEQKVHGSLQFYQDDGRLYTPDWAGTLDMRAVNPKTNQLYIIDLKTGKQPPASTNLQTAAYTIAVYPIGYDDVKRMALKLHVDRKKYGTKPYDNLGDFTQWRQEVLRYQRNNPPQ